jgi:hypothetical protein
MDQLVAMVSWKLEKNVTADCLITATIRAAIHTPASSTATHLVQPEVAAIYQPANLNQQVRTF